MPETIRLRGHHLLCILTYIGKGYSRAFTDNFDATILRLNDGAPVEIVSGFDALCTTLKGDKPMACHKATRCRQDRVKAYDQVALELVSYVLQMPMLWPGEKLSLGRGEIVWMRQHFAQGAFARACSTCSWHDVCMEIAAKNFHGTKLLPPRPTLPKPCATALEPIAVRLNRQAVLTA